MLCMLNFNFIFIFTIVWVPQPRDACRMGIIDNITWYMADEFHQHTGAAAPLQKEEESGHSL